MLASHQALYLGSREREPSPARRAAWLRAALATAERGEESARDPAALALLRGMLLWAKSEDDPDIAWPGGREAMRAAARAAFERAAELGDDRAREVLSVLERPSFDHAARD